MKKRLGGLWMVAAMTVLAMAMTAAVAGAEGHLTVVLDNNKEMRAIGAVETAISYINALMQGYAKNAEPPELEVHLYQICADAPLFGDTRSFFHEKTCIVGDGRQFFAETRSSAKKESPIVLPATKEKMRNFIFDWASKADGVILISLAPEAKALNLGDGFHRVIIPALDAKGRLAKNPFTTELQGAVDEFLDVVETPRALVTEFKAAASSSYTFVPVAFSVGLEGSETAMVDFGDGKGGEYRTGVTLRHAYSKAGRYTATARASAKDPGKAATILVADPGIAGLTVSPGQLTPAEDAVVTFTLKGAPSAEIRFGDGTAPAFTKPTGDGGQVTVRHRYGKAGSYTLQAIPHNGERTFAAATAAVVVSAEPRSLGIVLSANRGMATLPDGTIEFSATLDNAVRAEMDYGDGTPKEEASARMAHAYAKAGSYEAKLTAWAAEGSSASRTCQVKIEAAPVPAPSCTFEPESATTTVGGAIDIRCRFQNTESATAHFSDGEKADLTIGPEGTATIRHEFRSAGAQSIVVKMKGNGKMAEARCPVAVNKPEESFGTLAVYVSRDGEDVPLENDGAGHYRVKAGEEITLKAEKARNVSITVNYGDESDPEHGTTTSHVYQEGGEYIIEVNAKGTLSKTQLTKKSLTVTVTDGSPLPGILAVLVVLAAAFGVGKAVAQGKRKLAVTGPDGKETKRKPGRVELDPGVEVQVSVGKGGALTISLLKGSASAEGRSLTEQPVKFGRRVEIRTVGGGWTIELL